MIYKPEPRFFRLLLQFGVAMMLVGIQLPAVADTLYISKVTTYRNADRVQPVVREECQMDVRLPTIIRREIEKLSLFSGIALVDDPLANHRGLALIVTIVSLDLSRGGGWSTSPKFMKIKAVLYKDGTMVEEFSPSARITHRVELHKSMRSNCHIAEDLAEEVSEEVAKWLRKTGIRSQDPINSRVPDSEK